MRTFAVLTVAVGLCAVPAVPAVAASSPPPAAQARLQRAEVPPSGVFAIAGHGWGHGHGLSQWGAQGAAELGVNANDILAAYYPGTAAGTQSARTLRVLLSGDEGKDTVVGAAVGLAVTDLNGAKVDANVPTAPTVLPTGTAYAYWRAVRSGAGFLLQSSSNGSSWTPGQPMSGGPIRFSNTASVLKVSLPNGVKRDYRGRVAAVANGNAQSTVDVLDMEDYLRGVVPRESPSSWRPAALQAQAVAARSYATYEADHAPAGQFYDLCDTDSCQVYGGVPAEAATTDAAIAATARGIRTWQGKAAFTQFSSSNGGWTSAGSQPYLNAHADPWDGVDPANTANAWSATLTAAQVQARYPSVGTLTSIEVTSRDGNGEWGGRVATVLLRGIKDGVGTTVQATGYGIYQSHPWPSASDGLRSEWWHIVGAADTVVPTSQPAGIVPQKPTSLMESGRYPIRAGAPRRVRISWPTGATALLVNVTAKASSTTTGALLVGPSGGRQIAAVPLSPGTTATGQVLIPVPKDGKLLVGVSRGSAGARVQLVGAVLPGGAVFAPASPVKTLRVVNGEVDIPATAATALLGVVSAPGKTVTVGGISVVGAGSVMVSPNTSGKVAVSGKGPVSVSLLAVPATLSTGASGVQTTIPRPSSRSVDTHPSYLTVSGAAPGQTVLLHISAKVTTRVWPAGTKGPVVTIAAGTSSNVVLTLRDQRLLVQTQSGTGAVAVVPMARISR